MASDDEINQAFNKIQSQREKIPQVPQISSKLGRELSDPVFGKTSNDFLITTNPEQFFEINENAERLLILIALKFLIEQYLAKPCCTSFKKIMTDWKEGSSPIGIFYRMEYQTDFSKYDYLTTADLSTISKNNLFDLWTQISYLQNQEIYDKGFIELGIFEELHPIMSKFLFVFNKR